jgi:rubredoxin
MAKGVVKSKKARASATKTVQSKAKAQKAKQATVPVIRRYKCRFCNYIYSPLRGEPHNGIPEGTEFDDLPDTYICPVCGYQGKGKIGKWGFEEWRPTKYICAVCGYVYDEERGEPHHGIKPGTRFEDLPDDYVCPICTLDTKISKGYGKVFKQSFDPLDV